MGIDKDDNDSSELCSADMLANFGKNKGVAVDSVDILESIHRGMTTVVVEFLCTLKNKMKDLHFITEFYFLYKKSCLIAVAMFSFLFIFDLAISTQLANWCSASSTRPYIHRGRVDFFANWGDMTLALLECSWHLKLWPFVG
jgi:hypothetical protein